ncbi:leukotriene B4 receptor 1 [Clupea harengus]|uniref:Leukotriene B4 receptor 1 n=1 Tax=Clupea harengus TaxID=7950 RepID=A0A8M1KBH3_CLUHA|nr:leukotriene B4 receptor 1 [Clupea harengus]
MNTSGTSNPNDTTMDEWSMASIRVACVILSLSFMVGAPGNLLVIWTILKHVKKRSHTVVLILHLAIADLLVLITLPLWIYSLANSWIFGQVMCKATAYVVNACMYSSVFLLTIMSVERLVAIRYPFKMLGLKNVDMLKKCLGVMWFSAFLLGIPVILTLYVDKNDDGTPQCAFKKFTSVSELFCVCLETSMGFVIPFSILAICYCQVARELKQIRSTAKRRTTVLISSVVLAFALLWLPHHILNITDVIILSTGISEPTYKEFIVHIAGALVFISSAVNPVLYAFAARNFQGGLRNSGFVKLFLDVASNSLKNKRTLRVGEVQDSTTQSEL